MPIPDADRAIVTVEKVRDYLLNAEHPDGGSKAIWFKSLGYSSDAWQFLAKDLASITSECDDFDEEKSLFGVKYVAAGLIGRPGFRQSRVLTVWIVENNGPPRLVTAYPDEH